jgi:hypothetical protein
MVVSALSAGRPGPPPPGGWGGGGWGGGGGGAGRPALKADTTICEPIV